MAHVTAHWHWRPGHSVTRSCHLVPTGTGQWPGRVLAAGSQKRGPRVCSRIRGPGKAARAAHAPAVRCRPQPAPAAPARGRRAFCQHVQVECHLCPPQCAAAATCAMGRPTRAHWSAGAQCGTLTGWQLTSASFNLKFQGTVTGAVTLMAECSLPVQRGAAAGAPAGQRAATAWVAHTTRHAKMPMPDSETPPMRTAAGGPGVTGSLRNRPVHGEISSSGRCTGISGAWRASAPQSDSDPSVRTCGASAHAPASGTPPLKMLPQADSEGTSSTRRAPKV